MIAGFLASRLAGFFASHAAPYVITLFVFLGGFAVGGAATWDWVSSRAKVEIAAMKDEQQQHKEEEQQAEIARLRQVKMERDAAELRANAISVELARARNALAEARVQLSRNVPRVTTIYRPAPDAAPVPLPACVFTTGFVRDWNTALGIVETSPATGDATDDTRAASEADGLSPSDITQADILANHIDNAIRCRAIENQLTGLIDWQKGVTNE